MNKVADKVIPMRRHLAVLSISILLTPGEVAAAPVVEAPPSMTHHRCYICHADREVGVGPAFADVAAFYRGKKNAVPLIAGYIRQGVRGGGPWHMPPHPEISPAEAREMARYIMSLPPEKAAPLQVNRR